MVQQVQRVLPVEAVSVLPPVPVLELELALPVVRAVEEAWRERLASAGPPD